MTNRNKKNVNKKREKPLVYKPYLRGRTVSSLATRRGFRILGYLLVSMVLYFFLGQLLAVDHLWLRILVNSLVILGFAALIYSDGAKIGEGDVAFAEIALSRKNEGKNIDATDLARCYHPGKGFFTVLVGALPVILLCLIYAFLAKEETYSLGALPSWVSSFENRPDVGPALAYYHERAGFQALDLLRLITRLLIFPYVNLVGTDNKSAILMVERLSPLLVSIIPVMYGVGYMQGPRFRAMVHGGIASNQRKAQRKKIKRKLPPRQQPKQLI